MKKNNKTIETLLRETRFLNLSEREANSTWNSISTRIESGSAFSVLPVNKRKTMIPLLIGALLFASAGGTVAASNSAAPGDALFGVDRAVENIRVAMTRGEGKAELKLKFAEERLLEVEDLVARARAEVKSTSTASSTATTTATSTATTTATTTPKRVNTDVALGVNIALAYLNEVAADLSASGNAEAAARLAGVIDRLENITNDSDVKVRLKSDDNFLFRLKGGSASSTASTTGDVRINTSGNKDRIEVREDGGRIKIEIKDNGNIKIKSKTEVEIESEDEDEDDEDDKDENRNSGRGNGLNINLNLR